MKLSPRTIEACAMFGLDAREAATLARPPHPREFAHQIEAMLKPGEVALITGPSGGGKSTLLRAFAHTCTPTVRVAPHQRRRQFPRTRSVIDLFRSPTLIALRHLAASGLADATILALRPDQLSDGQRARLALALAFERAQRKAGATLLIDEFASTLDRATARSLARTLSRWISRTRCRAICATAHDDLLPWLRPQVLIVQPLHAPAQIARSPFEERTDD